jgi:hypothetical protein
LKLSYYVMLSQKNLLRQQYHLFFFHSNFII